MFLDRYRKIVKKKKKNVIGRKKWDLQKMLNIIAYSSIEKSIGVGFLVLYLAVFIKLIYLDIYRSIYIRNLEHSP